jgi:hypothetical protein
MSTVRELDVHLDSDVTMTSRHCYCENLLCSTPADPVYATFTALCYVGDTTASAGDWPGGLLQLHPRGCDQNTADSSAISPQSCCSAGVFCLEV